MLAYACDAPRFCRWLTTIAFFVFLLLHRPQGLAWCAFGIYVVGSALLSPFQNKFIGYRYIKLVFKMNCLVRTKFHVSSGYAQLIRYRAVIV